MKNKGFTLIELLAVIVILAVIALIATPMILNVIETAREGAAKSSANGYLDSVELYLSTAELNNKMMLEPNQKYNLTNVTLIGAKAYPALNDLVEIKGEKPTGVDDYIMFSDNYKVIEGKLTLNGYIAAINNGEMTVIKSDAIKVEDITLNFESQTMEKGSTTKIEVTFTPVDTTNQKVSYKSSDSNIVSVDEKGNIKALQNGTATITVTSVENKNIKKIVNVEVITLTKANEETYIGDTNQLTATIEPGDATTTALTWSSNNPSVATVSTSGLVTGLSEGIATITATTQNGKIATIDIEIKSILADSIEISGYHIAGLNKTTQYTAKILPENTTDKTVIWKSSDNTVATVSESGLVSGLKEGTVTITATTSNGIEITKQISIQELKLCMRANVETLHTEECSQADAAYYCNKAGYTASNKGTTIKYGNQTVIEGTLTSGDAFDCDVNGDGYYDTETERFYYVSGLNGDNTNDVKVLIYYNNTSRDINGNIQPDNTSSSLIAYYPSIDENWRGPIEAIKNLPTVNEWKNVSLTNASRNITNRFNVTTTGEGLNTIENPFVYKNANNVNYAARLLNYQEVAACVGDGTPILQGELDAYNYLMENTKYSNSNIGTYGYWLETPLETDSHGALYVDARTRRIITTGVHYGGYTGVRPAIEVLKTNISY